MRSSPSCHSGKQFEARSPQRHVVEDGVGRAGARAEAGRDRRWPRPPPGQGRARPPRTTARATSYQVATPLIGDVEDTRQSLAGASTAKVWARSAVKVGEPRWSSTKRQGPVAPGQAQDGAHDVGAAHPAHPRRAHDGGRRIELAFAPKLALAVDRRRVGLVPFDIGACRGAVKDVIGRHVDDVGVEMARRLGQVPGTHAR